MQTNWSLVVNVILLVGVFIAIIRLLKARRQAKSSSPVHPSLGPQVFTPQDEIIAVRKIDQVEKQQGPSVSPTLQPVMEKKDRPNNPTFAQSTINMSHVVVENALPIEDEPLSSLVMFLLAKENRQLAGYELLQTVLAAGLRFGEGHLFHRHQSPNGQGPVLCSLAAATPSGIFDLQNIGAFSVHGLCLFMHASGNSTIDAERFGIMLDTAKQLSEGLDTYLLDDLRQPLTDTSIKRYHQLLKLDLAYNESEPAFA
jgi:cell division protein ZipA